MQSNLAIHDVNTVSLLNPSISGSDLIIIIVKKKNLISIQLNNK